MTDAVLPTPILPDVERLRTYLFWSFWVGVAFFGVYPAMNWITSLRRTPLHLYLPVELKIPFIPQFIWVWYVLPGTINGNTVTFPGARELLMEPLSSPWRG